jgi:hypothetical protein
MSTARKNTREVVERPLKRLGGWHFMSAAHQMFQNRGPWSRKRA